MWQLRRTFKKRDVWMLGVCAEKGSQQNHHQVTCTTIGRFGESLENLIPGVTFKFCSRAKLLIQQ